MLICFFGGVFLGPVCVCVRFPTAGLARPRKKRSVFFIFFLVGRLESSKLIVGVCVLFLGFFFVSASLSIYRNSRVRPLSMRLLAFIYFFWFIFNRIFGNRNPTLPPLGQAPGDDDEMFGKFHFFSLKKIMENRTISIPAETRFPTECYRVFVLFLPSFLSAARQLELVPYRVVPSFFFFSFQSMDVVFSYEQAQVDSVYRVLPSFTEFFSVDFVERRPNKEPDVFCFCFFFCPMRWPAELVFDSGRVSLWGPRPPLLRPTCAGPPLPFPFCACVL